MVDIRLLHHRQKLPCVGRQGLHVATLPFGVNRVEGERGLARAGKTRKHDELVPRQAQVDIAQVVRSRAANVDGPSVDGFHVSAVNADQPANIRRPPTSAQRLVQ